MVKYYTEPLDVTFMALSDATRRAILMNLAKGDCTVSELSAPFDISLPAISKHLRVLENAGLISQKKEGRIRRCKLEADAMRDAAKWIGKYKKFWEKQFDALDNYLEKSKQKEGNS